MGADLLIVYYGIRYEVPEAEIEQIENEKHNLIIAATQAKLNYFSARFDDDITKPEVHYLFIGTEMGIFGREYQLQKQINAEALISLMTDTQAKLRNAKINGEPHLWLQFRPDY